MPSPAMFTALAKAVSAKKTGAKATTKKTTKLVVGGKPASITSTTTTTVAPRTPFGLPVWVLVLGGLGVLAAVWYVTGKHSGKRKGGRARASRRPFFA